MVQLSVRISHGTCKSLLHSRPGCTWRQYVTLTRAATTAVGPTKLADAHSERAGVSGFKHFLRNVASCRRVTLRPQPSVAVQW